MWSEFFTGPKRTALAPDELIVGVEWPIVDGPGSFAKVGTRNAMVIAIADVCLQLDPGARAVRLALGSVAPTVVRVADAEDFASAAVAWDDPERPVSPAVCSDANLMGGRPFIRLIRRTVGLSARVVIA